MRDVINLVEANSSTVYYHVTFASRVPKIKKQGLLVGRKRNWEQVFGDKQGSTKHLYLMTDFTPAVRWAFKMQWDFKRDIAIIVIDDFSGEVMPDDHPENWIRGEGAWVMTAENIPPQYISRVIPLTNELSRQVAQTGRASLPD